MCLPVLARRACSVEFVELLEPLDVAAVRGHRVEPGVERVERRRRADERASEAEHVGVVVLAREVRRRHVVHVRGANARDLLAAIDDADARPAAPRRRGRRRPRRPRGRSRRRSRGSRRNVGAVGAEVDRRRSPSPCRCSASVLQVEPAWSEPRAIRIDSTLPSALIVVDGADILCACRYPRARP